jgi:hypothetical protein
MAKASTLVVRLCIMGVWSSAADRTNYALL